MRSTVSRRYKIEFDLSSDQAFELADSLNTIIDAFEHLRGRSELYHLPAFVPELYNQLLKEGVYYDGVE